MKVSELNDRRLCRDGRLESAEYQGSLDYKRGDVQFWKRLVSANQKTALLIGVHDKTKRILELHLVINGARFPLKSRTYAKMIMELKRILSLPEKSLDAQRSAAHNKTWKYSYKQLCKYRKAYPEHWPQGDEEYPLGYNLGHWCSTQRGACRRNTLTPEHKRLLERIRFPFNPQAKCSFRAQDL